MSAKLKDMDCTGCGRPATVDRDCVRYICGRCVMAGRKLPREEQDELDLSGAIPSGGGAGQ